MACNIYYNANIPYSHELIYSDKSEFYRPTMDNAADFGEGDYDYSQKVSDQLLIFEYK